MAAAPAGTAMAGAALLLAALERLAPLRRRVESQARRIPRNAALGGLWLAVVIALQPLVLVPVARWAQAHEFGLLRLADGPGWLEAAAAVALLDYTLWHWHRWNHRVPWLWRFHLVHHVDRDLDASTALRFHFGEMALSMPYRAAQVALVGAEASAVSLWTSLLFVSVLFHHSNLRLPMWLERALVPLVVTPRMHGIHHSQRHDEVDTNFASLLTLWDYLHRTIRLDVPQQSVVIGVPAYPEPAGLLRLLALPFQPQGEYWPGQPPAPPRTEKGAARLAP